MRGAKSENQKTTPKKPHFGAVRNRNEAGPYSRPKVHMYTAKFQHEKTVRRHNEPEKSKFPKCTFMTLTKSIYQISNSQLNLESR